MLVADVEMMRRALTIARGGSGHTYTNPLVGAVITDGLWKIYGEGYHRRWGGPHAEVNAVAGVISAGYEDKLRAPETTIYVTLEPCSHYGKTPPCAKMLVNRGIRNVVIGSLDPNPRVAGRGAQMLRDAGAYVRVGLLEEECIALNAPFMTAHTLGRPFVTLKWAQTADGYMDARREAPDSGALRISTPEGAVMVHRLRARADAIMVGSGTALADKPRLDCRLWPAADFEPRPIVADRRGRVELSSLFGPERRALRMNSGVPLEDAMRNLYEHEGVLSVLVEGGAALLNAFLESGLWDVARVEKSPVTIGSRGAVRAPQAPGMLPLTSFPAGQNSIIVYSQNRFVHVKYL